MFELVEDTEANQKRIPMAKERSVSRPNPGHVGRSFAKSDERRLC